MGLNKTVEVCMGEGLLTIKVQHSSGYGEFLKGEYGVGYGSGFAAIVTPATLEFLKIIGIANDNMHLIIQGYSVKNLDKLKSDVKESIDTIMSNSPRFVNYEHVIWEHTKTFFEKPRSGVFPPGQVVWMMLRELGLKQVDCPWVETATPIAYGNVFVD